MKAIIIAVVGTLLLSQAVQASELCDTRFQNCRVPLVKLIDQEQVGIDWFTWFASDMRYVAALDRARKRGVRIRVIGNSRKSVGQRATMDALVKLGIPVRFKRTTGGAHTKAMIFAGQMVVEHGGANYSDQSFVPIIPYANYIDEVVMINRDPDIVRSFMVSFDDEWTNTYHFRNYGNASNPRREYPSWPIDHRVQLTTPYNEHEIAARLVELIDNEREGIDLIMYRLTRRLVVDALIRARQRGVPVRILSDPESMSYRTHPQEIAKLKAVGVKVKNRIHAGLEHEKLGLFRGQDFYVFGSQNWEIIWSGTYEHNLFDNDPADYAWFVRHFEQKWNASKEFR